MFMTLHFIHHSNIWKLKDVWLAGPALWDSDGAAAQGVEMAKAGPAGSRLLTVRARVAAKLCEFTETFQ